MTITAQIRDQDGDSASARTTNLVADAPLTATGTTIDARRNQAFKNVVVARFNDGDPHARPSDFAATIAWGDQTTSAGKIVRDPVTGGFQVKGSHTYKALGAFAVQVSIRDGGKGVVSTSFFTPTNLISDGAVPADHIDPNLINPWGIVAGAASPWWINDAGAGVSTLVDGAGNPNAALPFVTVPPSAAGADPSAPTGIVVQNTAAHPNDFVVSENGHSGASVFIFATEDGTISGWNPGVDRTHAIREVDNSSAGAVYKGLALPDGPERFDLTRGSRPAGHRLPQQPD